MEDGSNGCTVTITPLSTLCSSPNLEIPDNNSTGVTDNLIVSDSGSLTDLNVSVDVTHTYVGDLIFTLTHVDTGTSVTIIDRPGSPANTFGCRYSDIDATLDDEASFLWKMNVQAAPQPLMVPFNLTILSALSILRIYPVRGP